MYYIFEADKLRKIRHLIYGGDDGWGLSFLKGYPLTPPAHPDQLKVEFETEAVALPDYFEANSSPIVNDKVAGVLNGLKLDNIQLFPVKIEFPEKQVPGYYALNVIGRFNAIDVDASETTQFRGRVARMKKLQLKEGRFEGAEMFRDDQYQELIFVSERVKLALEAAAISGALYPAANGWSDAHRF